MSEKRPRATALGRWNLAANVTLVLKYYEDEQNIFAYTAIYHLAILFTTVFKNMENNPLG